jgi:site-specific DNA-methyltransferase (adenine-specific)
MSLELDYIYCGDCLEIMPEIADKSVDMILCDLPYGTTACSWDTIIPFEPLWAQYKRTIKPNGAIVLTASQPFTSTLVMSNLKMFKYEWIWEKDAGTGFLNAKKYPLKNTENILIFCNGVPKYNPQMRTGKPYKTIRGRKSDNYGKDTKKEIITDNNGDRYPVTGLKFNRDKNKLHPTQKPVALFEYLIRTYTNPGDLVLDNCIGSGTTAVACIRTGRHFIGIEKDVDYCIVAQERVNQELENKNLLDNPPK